MFVLFVLAIVLFVLFVLAIVLFVLLVLAIVLFVLFVLAIVLFVLFVLAIVLFVLFQFTTSDYPFGIFKLLFFFFQLPVVSEEMIKMWNANYNRCNVMAKSQMAFGQVS